MPANKRSATKRTSQSTFFIHPAVAATYQLASDRQGDTTLIIPQLKWRGLLSRITPAVAQHLAQEGILITVIPTKDNS